MTGKLWKDQRRRSGICSRAQTGQKWLKVAIGIEAELTHVDMQPLSGGPGQDVRLQRCSHVRFTEADNSTCALHVICRVAPAQYVRSREPFPGLLHHPLLGVTSPAQMQTISDQAVSHSLSVVSVTIGYPPRVQCAPADYFPLIFDVADSAAFGFVGFSV